ncbi:MAG: single-stranded DNA-binding protein [Anaerolineae bacterium]|nr:single-stranded DNA-binding protein [Anaerolineae bacterium]
MDKLIVTGNLGRDAELRYAPNGSPICQFSVAATRKWKDRDGEKKEHTNWYRCAIWGKRGEALAQYLVKGTRVLVEGRLNGDGHGGPRVWRTDGSNDSPSEYRASFEVTVEEIELLGGSNRKAGGGSPGHAQGADTGDDGLADFGDFPDEDFAGIDF